MTEGTLSWEREPHAQNLLEDLARGGWRTVTIVDVEITAETARERALQRWDGRRARQDDRRRPQRSTPI